MTNRDNGGVAVVTGAARGIGAATAARLARDGFAVAVLDCDEEGSARSVEAITADGGAAMAVTADVSDEVAVGRAVALIAAELGPPAVLVNNAGYGEPAGVLEMTAAQWDGLLAVNLRGAFLAARAACPHMVAAGWGRVISISSVSALGDDGRAGYASAKAGLIGFTKTLALELGPHGVTANAVAPGFVVSEMTRLSARRRGVPFDEYQRAAARSVPVGRVGQPEDVADAVAFFASPRAGYVSGQVLYVAGGPVD